MSAEVLDGFSELITTALGLVAARNAAIQQLFTQPLGEADGALAAKFFYAFIVALIIIFATISVGRGAGREARGGTGQWPTDFGRSKDEIRGLGGSRLRL